MNNNINISHLIDKAKECRFVVSINEEETRYTFKCPKCSHSFYRPAYMPHKLSLFKCNTCGFSNPKDNRYY